MSVVVRMEIPENCFVCPFQLGCSAYRAYSFSTSTRRVLPKPLDEGCNILAVLPEGHGRLVDASTVIYVMQVPVTVDDASCIVHALPTIVPAESSET